MNRTVCIVATLALLGCKDKGTDSGGTGDNADCGVVVDKSFPTADQSDFYWKSGIEFHLSGADSTAVASLADSSGAEVSGTQWIDEESDIVYFEPDDGLAPSTSYTASLAYCGGNPSVSFTTSGLGESLSDPSVLEGKTYLIDLTNPDIRFIEPEGVAELLLSQLENSILMGVVTAGSEIDMIGGISVTGSTEQDTCSPSIDFPAADFSTAPYFAVGPQNTPITVAGVTVEIANFELSGTFASDATYVGGARLAGELDARDLAPVLGDLIEDTDPDYVCDLVEGFGVPCQACSLDGAEYCIGILADSIVATELDGITLQEITVENCDIDCADSYTNDECDTSGW